jgi:lysozyme
MKMSAEGRKRLTEREGVRLKAYLDTKGIPTIGIGHTSMAGQPRVEMGMTITRQECDEIFLRDLAKYERAVNDVLKVPVAPNEFDALVSFCYNIGPGGLARSTTVRKLNAGDRKGAADGFLLWDKPPEIMGRRRSERQQFLTPYSSPGRSTAVTTGTVAAGTAAAAKQAGVGLGEIAIMIGIILLVGAVVYHFRKGH